MKFWFNLRKTDKKCIFNQTLLQDFENAQDELGRTLTIFIEINATFKVVTYCVMH